MSHEGDVREHDKDSSTLWAESVLDGDLDVVVANVSGTSDRRVAGFDGLCFNALNSGNQDDGKSVLGFAAGCETERNVKQNKHSETGLLTSLQKHHW